MSLLIDIPGFENQYLINESGDIYSIVGKTFLKPSANKKGYLYVKLKKGNKRKTCYIHVLVAETFIPKPNYKCEVNHKNGIKSNCHKDNLEWLTHKENIEHSIKTGLRKPKRKFEWWKLNQEQLAALEQQGGFFNV
jgi:hypothetical protein